MGKAEEAVKYIKRIVIWPSTNAKIKELYDKLVKMVPKEEEKREVTQVYHSRKRSFLKKLRNQTRKK